MGKPSGWTRTVGSSSASASRSAAPSVASSASTSSAPTTSTRASATAVKIPPMPAANRSTSFKVNGQEFTISHAKFYSSRGPSSGGRFTLGRPDGSYTDFSYGSSYAGYTSKGEAYRELKDWVKRFYIK